MDLIIDNGYSHSEYDADLKVIYTTYKGLVHVKLGKESMMAQQKQGLEHGLIGAIADFSELKGTFTMLNEWAEKAFFPPLLANGLKFLMIRTPHGSRQKKRYNKINFLTEISQPTV